MEPNKVLSQAIGFLATYELPALYPRMREKTAYTVGTITVTEEGFEVPLTCREFTDTNRCPSMKPMK